MFYVPKAALMEGQFVLKQEKLERAMDLLALGIEAYNNRNK